MAITTCKVTYSLRPETVDRVQELATKWGVPKSEVIRRVVDGADAIKPPLKLMTPLQALESLGKHGISAEAAARYNREIRRERRAWRSLKK